VTVHCQGSVVVIVLVQAMKPSGADAGVASSEQADEGWQLVTVVVPGSIGAGVGQTIIQWMPVVTDVKEQPMHAVRFTQQFEVCVTDPGSR
jgi:hypothetical protein